MSDQKKSSKLGLGLIIGSIAGAIAGIFFAPKSGKKTREEIAKKLTSLKEKIGEGELQESVKEIFGEVTDETMKLFNKARKDLANKIDKLIASVEDIDKEKYVKIAEEVIADLKKESKVSADRLNKLKDYLVEDWNRVMKGTSKQKNK